MFASNTFFIHSEVGNFMTRLIISRNVGPPVSTFIPNASAKGFVQVGALEIGGILARSCKLYLNLFRGLVFMLHLLCLPSYFRFSATRRLDLHK